MATRWEAGGVVLRATWQAANRHGDVRFGTGGRVGDPGTRRGEPGGVAVARADRPQLPRMSTHEAAPLDAV